MSAAARPAGRPSSARRPHTASRGGGRLRSRAEEKVQCGAYERAGGVELKLATSFGLAVIAALASPITSARGVSPYLPLNTSPEIERQIERVLILAGKPVMRKPIAAAVVLDALPRACERDQATCERVRRYLQNYMKSWGITTLKVEGAASSGDSAAVIPNSHGERIDSPWRASAHGYWQPNDYIIVNAGGVAYDGNATPTGSLVSLGFDWAQLDIGFRDHWYSPLTDSSSLISTEAPTMPSVTLSNYEPITPLGINYEVFYAEMSEQDGIPFGETTTSGRPRLAGIHLGLEPVVGYALSLNRLAQYGGGARNTSALSQFVDELFETGNLELGQVQGSNRVASVASSILFPGPMPFSVDIEYAGEDNAYAEGYRLGATNLTLGIDLPRIGKSFDANLEVSEWQNDWYVHGVYPKGLTNRGRVLGHWFGDQRVFGDAIGGDSQMVSVGWWRHSDQYFRATYRTMTLDAKWAKNDVPRQYERAHALGLSFSTHWQDFPLEFELAGGRDIFGKSFTRFSASMDLVARERVRSEDEYEREHGERGGAEVFVDVGANRSETTKILSIGTRPDPAARTTGAHLGIGARRSVSRRNDVGIRLELDEIDSETMLSLRAVDYRFRMTPRVAIGGFFGAARYNYGLATIGYYWGAGIQLQDILPKWDLGFDFRHYEKLNRDKTLPSDPVPSPETHPRLYIDVDGMSFYVSRRW
jgi:hypothetical protein